MLSNRTEVTVTVTVIVIMTQGEWCGGVRATSTSKNSWRNRISMLGFGLRRFHQASHTDTDIGTGTGSWLPFHVAVSTSADASSRPQPSLRATVTGFRRGQQARLAHTHWDSGGPCNAYVKCSCSRRPTPALAGVRPQLHRHRHWQDAGCPEGCN